MKRLAVALLFFIQSCCGDRCPDLCQCFSATMVICSDDKMKVLPLNISAQVKEMIVVASGITHLEKCSFKKNSNLSKLVILNTLLKVVSYNAFDHVFELQELEISGNHNFLTFEVQTFSKLANLTRLFLNNNRISVLYNDTFDSLEKLEMLQLRGNRLTYLPGVLLQNLHQLQELDLSFNHISSISADVFQNNSLLRVLFLQGNMISQVPLFSHLDNLEELNLQNNFITNLDAKVFPSSLRKLVLKRNTLVQLPPVIFHKLQLLSYLDLSQNQLSKLPIDLFQNLISLKILDLSENQIISLPSTVFKGLFNVKAINLQTNNLTLLEDNLFKDQQVMEQLYLSVNRLQSIPYGLFDYLDFQCIVHLHGNPWRCDCGIHYFFNWLRYNYRNVEDLSRIYCNEPDFIRGHNLLSMDKEMLVCVKNSSSELRGPDASVAPSKPSKNSMNQCSIQEFKGAISIQCKVRKCITLKFQALFEPLYGNESKYIVSKEWQASTQCLNGTF